jgi:DNA-3-methyladenine glycosylase II
MTPVYWQIAAHQLTINDPVMGRLIKQHDDVVLKSRGDAFATLARSIIGQQISVKAAECVWQKMICIMPDISPQVIHDMDEYLLRQCGVSYRKISYLYDLSHYFMTNKLNVAEWNTMGDEALIEQLTRIKGIGRWTAEMFLIFHMLRPDIFPVADIGLQRAISLHYFDSQTINKKNMLELGQCWKPWRSVATWYLWRSLDPLPVEY